MKRIVSDLFSRFQHVALLTFLVSLLGIPVLTSSGQAATTVNLVNRALLVANQPFSVDLTVEDVVDFYGVGFTLVYDSQLIQVVTSSGGSVGQEFEIDEGTVLNNSDSEATLLRSASKDGVLGSLVYGHSRSGSSSGVDVVETEVVSSLSLIPLQAGDFTLSFASPVLRDSTVAEIPGTFNGLTVHVYNDSDSDSDLMSDEWEIDVFGDISTAGEISDYDDDTFSDYQEYLNMLAGMVDQAGNLFDPLLANANGIPIKKSSIFLMIIPAVIHGR